MLNRSHILSLAALAAIGAVAFVTSASAKPAPVLQRATSIQTFQTSAGSASKVASHWNRCMRALVKRVAYLEAG